MQVLDFIYLSRMRPSPESLRKRLLEVEDLYHLSGEIQNDAIAPALKYKRRSDQEFAAFICAILAFGNVASICRSARRVLDPMGSQPVKWLKNSNVEDIGELTASWVHRWNTSADMGLMLWILRQVYLSGTLESLVSPLPHETAAQVLERLIDRLCALDAGPFGPWPHSRARFWTLLSRPSKGSACKRLNLFLRWMVGNTPMDLSLWNSMSRRNLVIPLDTHVLRQAQRLGLCRSKAANWKTAEEITEKLRKLDPENPVRFDFALCHLGIRGESGWIPK